jgi:hypothetical protein
MKEAAGGDAFHLSFRIHHYAKIHKKRNHGAGYAYNKI